MPLYFVGSVIVAIHIVGIFAISKKIERMYEKISGWRWDQSARVSEDT